MGKDSVFPGRQIVATADSTLNQRIKREAALFLTLLFFGFVILPVAIYLVGDAVFGEYGGAGFADFFGTLSAKIRAGEPATWFLILSPYLVWQAVRLTVRTWHRLGRAD